MLTESNTQSKKFEISTVQRILFNVLIFVLPWFILPLPWDFTERGKSLILIGLSTLIILLEVLRWVWDGKITILRSPLDVVVIALLLSVVLSTVFAKDTWVAVWGYDGKLASGLLVYLFLFGLFYFFRGFLLSKESLYKSIEVLLLGISVLTFLSLLSFFRVNVFSLLPIYKDLVAPGLPLTFSFKGMLILSGTAMLFSSFLGFTYIKNKQYTRLWYLVLILLISMVAFVVFSINQGILIPLILSLSMVFIAVLFAFKSREKERYVPKFMVIVSVLLLICSIGIQFTSVRNAIFGSELEILTPLSLGNDMSWQISTSALVSNVMSGLFGLGNDSFPIAYTLSKPLTTEVLNLGNTVFSYASSEVLTLLATRGIIGLGIWILVGVSIVKLIVKDIEKSNENEDFHYIIPEIVLLFLFLCSFVAPYSVIISFTFFFTLLVTTIVRILPRVNKEYFVLKFWAMDIGDINKNLNKSISGINWFLTSILIVLAGIVLVKVFAMMVSSAYLLKAEAYSRKTNAEYTSKDVTLDDREVFLEQYLGYYDKAMSFEYENPLIHRQSGLISLEILNLLSDRYTDASEEDKKNILSNVSTWKNLAIEYSRESIKISPYTYANWNARATIYAGLVGVGLSDYSQDAVSTLQQCIALNPLDYNSYYQIGQIYMVTKEYEKSLAAFNQGLSINGQHVPSLVFAAQILSQQNDTKAAISYLEAAKKILETNKQEKTDLYKNVAESLSKLSGNVSDDSNSNSAE